MCEFVSTENIFVIFVFSSSIFWPKISLRDNAWDKGQKTFERRAKQTLATREKIIATRIIRLRPCNRVGWKDGKTY